MSASQNLLDAVADPTYSRDEIASWYAAVIHYQPTAEWPALNRAILERYQPSGLEYIKSRAWAHLAALDEALK